MFIDRTLCCLVPNMVSHAQAQRNFWLHQRLWKTVEPVVWSKLLE